MFSHMYLYSLIVVGLACLDELRTTLGIASLSEGPSMPGGGVKGGRPNEKRHPGPPGP